MQNILCMVNLNKLRNPYLQVLIFIKALCIASKLAYEWFSLNRPTSLSNLKKMLYLLYHNFSRLFDATESSYCEKRSYQSSSSSSFHSKIFEYKMPTYLFSFLPVKSLLQAFQFLFFNLTLLCSSINCYARFIYKPWIISKAGISRRKDRYTDFRCFPTRFTPPLL